MLREENGVACCTVVLLLSAWFSEVLLCCGLAPVNSVIMTPGTIQSLGAASLPGGQTQRMVWCQCSLHMHRMQTALHTRHIVLQESHAFHCARTARQKANARHAATSQQQAPAICDALQLQFDTLASLVTPSTQYVQLDHTELGRGLVAKQDLPAGTPCISVDAFNLLCVTDEPLRTGTAFGSAALSDWQLLHGDLPPILANYLLSSRGDWFKRLVAWLLWLKRHGPDAWQLYVQLMPQEHEMASLMNFNAEERHELQCPEMELLAEQERTAIQGLHDSVFSSRTGDLASVDLAPDFTDTLWAACMVNSRCFSDVVGREALSLMVPCADMANHSMKPNAGYRLDPESQTFTITTTEDVPAGSEVLISYLGEKPTKSNMQLMKDYGFVLPGNLNDQLQLKPTSILQPQLKAAKLLEAAGQCSCSSDDAHKRRQQVVMKSLQPFVDLGSSGSSDGWAVSSSTPGLSTEQRQAVELVKQCRQQLDRHATSIQEDEALLSGAAGVQLTPRVQAAVVARLERKRLLAAAVDMLQMYADMSAQA